MSLMTNEYAGKNEQVIRITQPITVATRDNIYKNMATQRTRANLYKAGYRRTKAALQKQQKINAAMSTTLAAQYPTVTTQTVTMSPRVVQSKNPGSTNPNNIRISWNRECNYQTRTGKVHQSTPRNN